MNAWPTLAVFVVTYVFIAGRRLAVLPIGRPGGALVGACAMVALGAAGVGGLAPAEAFAAVEPNTIALLLGMMLLTAALAEGGFFHRAAAWIVRRRLSGVELLWAVTLGAGALSALLVNDSVCLLLAPLVDALARRAGLRRVPYLLALAMGSNAGSAITLAGNPQNMLVAHLSGISYRDYLLRAGPAGILALVTTAGVLHLLEGRSLTLDAPAGPVEPLEGATPALRPWVPIACIAGVSIAFLAGGSLAWSALGGATAAILLRGRDPGPLFGKVSWTVLVFFAALFIVVDALQKSGLPGEALAALGPHAPAAGPREVGAYAGALVAACQIVSNVPAILVARAYIEASPDPALYWRVTAVVSTLAGNLTLIGSVANVIVVEATGAEQELGFRRYLRTGVPVTLASTGVALAWLLLVR